MADRLKTGFPLSLSPKQAENTPPGNTHVAVTVYGISDFNSGKLFSRDPNEAF